jgi:hypothetical protein
MSSDVIILGDRNLANVDMNAYCRSFTRHGRGMDNCTDSAGSDSLLSVTVFASPLRTIEAAPSSSKHVCLPPMYRLVRSDVFLFFCCR